VTVDKSSKVFLEDELKGLIELLMRAMSKEIKIAEKQVKRMKS
jgi:hypothetical protein